MKKIIASILILQIAVVTNPAIQHLSAQNAKSGAMMVVKPAKPKIANRVPTKNSMVVNFNNRDYIRHNSKYYTKRGSRYLRMSPPFGLHVAALPIIHTSFVFNDRTYYQSEGVIYRPLANSQSEYEVVKPEVGMVVPALPEVNVSQVIIEGVTYFEFENLLYKQIPTSGGVHYEVVGVVE